MNKTGYSDASAFTAFLPTVDFTPELPFKNALKLCLHLVTHTDRLSHNIAKDMQQQYYYLSSEKQVLGACLPMTWLSSGAGLSQCSLDAIVCGRTS
jgi:hypothetical protein